MKLCCPPLVPRSLLGLWILTGGLLRAAPLDLVTEAGSPRYEELAPGDWAGVRKAHRDWQHRFLDGGDGTYSAANPGQKWRSLFDGTGFLTQPHSKSWEWGLELKAYGVGASLREAEGRPVISVEGTRLGYRWNDDLEEWFRNDERGLEQGWTLQRRPSGPGEEMLRLTLAVRGGLRPAIDRDGRGVSFAEKDGITALTYGGLKAWDAQGRNLPVRFASAGELLAIEVDEREAVYPIVIDPVARQAFLTASNPGENDEFGTSVAISGDTIVIGAPYEDSNTNTVNSVPNEGAAEAGAAYVFVRTDGVWSQQAYLKAANSGTLDGFGTSVAIDGDSIVVGAPYEASDSTGVNNPPNNNLPDSGAAYVYTRTGGVWTAQAYLKPSSAGADHFGSSVGISGDTIVVGAEYEDSSTTGINTSPDDLAIEAGAAYVFFRSGITWTQQAYLKAANTGADDRFGEAVAISGDTVVVGASLEDSGSAGVNNTPDELITDSGAVYVFTRSGVSWTQEAYLKANNPGNTDRFGYSVAISENNLVAGSIYEDSSTTGVNSTPNEAATKAGAAYVFTRSGITWSQQAYLKAGNAGAEDYFGNTVAISGNKIAVGAEGEDSSSTGVNSVPNEGSSGSGAVYVFSRVGNTWGQRWYLKADNTAVFNEFGGSVAIDDGTVVVGSAFESTGGDSAGASDVFTITPTAPLLNLTGKATIRTSKSKFTIKGTASDEDGDLVRVEARDSRSNGTRKFRPAQGTANWKYKTPLKSGRNKIQIRSVDASGILSTNRKVTIIRK